MSVNRAVLEDDNVEIACVAWTIEPNSNCRHFDRIKTVSIVDGNGDSVLSNLDTKCCQFNTVKNKIKLAIRGKLLVGYNLSRLLRLLRLDHPLKLTKDFVFSPYLVARLLPRKSRPSLSEIASGMGWQVNISNKPREKLKSARLIHDVWNVLRVYENESCKKGETFHVARFLIQATEESLELLNRNINIVRLAGKHATGFHATRLTLNHYERVVSIHFLHLDDATHVFGKMIKKVGDVFHPLRLLLHKDMVKYVQSRANVFLALFKTEVSQFSVPAPGSAEHVLLIKGERQGVVKTLEMILRMLMQLQKDKPNQIYSHHKDFYDPANASSAALAEQYGGFGKKILQPPPEPPHVIKKVTPKKVIRSSVLKNQNKVYGNGSLIQSTEFECVKARMCAVDDRNSNQELALTPRYFPIFPAETSPQCNEPKVITSHLYQVDRASMSQPRSELTEDYPNHQQQHRSREESACGSNTCHQVESSTVLVDESDPVGESSDDNEVDKPIVELNMTMSKAIADLVRCQDYLPVNGVDVKIAELVSSTEVMLSLKGTRKQLRDAYTNIQSLAAIAHSI